jgi:hypothetical protein
LFIGGAMTCPANPTVHIRDGSLYFSRALYDAYFEGLESVILHERAGKLLIMPVRHLAGGGLLLKIRNRQGDRVVHAREFFRDHALDETLDQDIPVLWDNDNAALVMNLPTPAQR